MAAAVYPVSSRAVAAAVTAVLRAAHVTTCLQAGISGAAASVAKSDESPVTVADFASEVVVVSTLRDGLGPEHCAMISEEDASMLEDPANASVLELVVAAANTGLEGARELSQAEVLDCLVSANGVAGPGQGTWILDPIDGTKGFLRGTQHQYAIGLGHMGGSGELDLGVIVCPNLPQAPVVADPSAYEGPRGIILVGIPGVGCWEFPLPDEVAASAAAAANLVTEGPPQSILPGGKPARASWRVGPSSWRVCESFESAHSSHSGSAAIVGRLGIGGTPVRVDSMVKYALLARGDAHLYLRLPRPGYAEKVWDHAAGAAVLRAAGGTVTTSAGAPLPFRRSMLLEGVTGIVASSMPAHLHADVIKSVP